MSLLLILNLNAVLFYFYIFECLNWNFNKANFKIKQQESNLINQVDLSSNDDEIVRSKSGSLKGEKSKFNSFVDF